MKTENKNITNIINNIDIHSIEDIKRWFKIEHTFESIIGYEVIWEHDKVKQHNLKTYSPLNHYFFTLLKDTFDNYMLVIGKLGNTIHYKILGVL